MNIRALTYARYHGKGNIGSTRLRVEQLYKYWPEYQEYKYGENPDVMVFQKVYVQRDWPFIERWEGIKILDICDPDWMEQQHIKQTLDAVDGAVVPTETLAEFLRQLTDIPIKVIPDRHDLEHILVLKHHKGLAKNAVWFGYSHNADLLKSVIPILEKRNISLTIISNDNPYVNRWAIKESSWPYYFKKFDEETLLEDLQHFDICILPDGNRAKDRFKSNNKATLAWLAGVPVVNDLDSLNAMETGKARNVEAKLCYNKAIKDYDVKLSVQEMKDFIEELRKIRG